MDILPNPNVGATGIDNGWSWLDFCQPKIDKKRLREPFWLNETRRVG